MDGVKFNIQLKLKPRQYIDVEINGEGESNDRLIEDIFNVADVEDSYVKLCTIPIPTGLYYGAGSVKGGIKVDIPIGFVPKMSANINFKYKQFKDNIYSFGVICNNNQYKLDFKGPSNFEETIDD